MKTLKFLALAISILLVLFLAAYLLLPRFGINFSLLLRRNDSLGLVTQPGFDVSVFAEGLSEPRALAFGPDGVLYVAERGAGQIVALPDANGDGRVDQVRVFASDLDRPHSLVYFEGSWYIGLPGGVVALTDEDGDGLADQIRQVFEHYTTGQHNTRTVMFLPDGRMVVAMGSSCNICEEVDPQRAAVTIFDGPAGEGERVFATGLRNAVGLAIHPETGELWAADNGRDLMGDDLPPETVYIVRDGGFYGWPFCHAGRIEDPDIGFPGACENVDVPVIELQAHSAPLGLAFYTGFAFPEEYQGDLFMAFHGSWNRSDPTGYKVVRIPLEGSEISGPVEDFVWGWLTEDSISGRPVGLAVGPDGALYISDDFGGRIFRVVYR